VCEQYVHDKHLPDYEEEESENMNTRKNAEWDIIVAVPLDDNTEVVIGNRHTDFEPYVVWWCYDGKDYRDGEYIQEYKDATKELARRIMPIPEAHRIGEMSNFMEQCDEVIPYADDKKAKTLYKNNYLFRRKVAEEYGKYWYAYLDDNTSDTKFDCVLDALSKAYEEWNEEE
jgi:hypothetical protein